MRIESPPTAARYERPDGERRGLVVVHTGDGKGKSTAAFGLALRAHGRGTLLALDRAYEPLRLEGRDPVPPALADRAWQLWSPNKALGLTGVRAGWAIKPPMPAASR